MFLRYVFNLFIVFYPFTLSFLPYLRFLPFKSVCFTLLPPKTHNKGFLMTVLIVGFLIVNLLFLVYGDRFFWL